MKLLPAKKRNVAVVCRGGIGDTLFFIPLLRALGKKGFAVTLLFYARRSSDCLFDSTLVHQKVHLASRAALLWYSIRHWKYFTHIYCNQFARGRLLLSCARFISCKMTQVTDEPAQSTPGRRRIPVSPHLTDGEQNLRMLFSEPNALIPALDQHLLPSPAIDRQVIERFLPHGTRHFYIIQVSSGNNTTPFKNYPAANWQVVIRKLTEKWPDSCFVLAGDDTETQYAAGFSGLGPRCIPIFGQTSLWEIFNLIACSDGYIGLESGLMHLAVSLGKRTATIFGASDNVQFGYDRLDPTNHLSIYANLPCRPCYHWKAPNTSRVKHASLCPDFACLTQLDPQLVFDKVAGHFIFLPA